MLQGPDETIAWRLVKHLGPCPTPNDPSCHFIVTELYLFRVNRVSGESATSLESVICEEEVLHALHYQCGNKSLP